MQILAKQIRTRNGAQVSKTKELLVSKWHALFDWSMAFYWILAFIFLAVALLMHYDVIHEIAPQKPL